jgi:hypothetical protein
MVVTIFLALNGMGVVFLLYVLVQFWKEGRRPKKCSLRRFTLLSRDLSCPKVFLVNRAPTFETSRPV